MSWMNESHCLICPLKRNIKWIKYKWKTIFITRELCTSQRWTYGWKRYPHHSLLRLGSSWPRLGGRSLPAEGWLGEWEGIDCFIKQVRTMLHSERVSGLEICLVSLHYWRGNFNFYKNDKLSNIHCVNIESGVCWRTYWARYKLGT